MSQFYKKSFYLDESRSRVIDVEWNQGYKEIYILDDGEEIHKFDRAKEALKGVNLKGKKGENLFIKLYKNPVRWEVKFGDQYLENSYQSAWDGVIGSSTIFYIIFSLTFVYITLIVAFLFEAYGSKIFSSQIFLSPVFIAYYILLGLIFTTAYLIRKGRLIWYYLGTILYALDTLSLFFMEDQWAGVQAVFSVLGLILRFTLIIILIRNFKHIRTMHKHFKAKKKNMDAELLDV